MSWNDVPCPKCKKMVSAAAVKCPYCQSDFSQDEIDQRKKKASTGAKLGCGSLIFLALLVGFCSLPASIPDEPGPTAKADAVAVFRKLTETTADCDRSAEQLVARVKANDEVTAYRAAQVAESACLSVSSEIRAIEVPSSLGKAAYDAATAALEVCSNAYIERWAFAKAFREGLGEGATTARIAEAQRSAESSSRLLTACSGEIVGAAMKVGANASDLGIADQPKAE